MDNLLDTSYRALRFFIDRIVGYVAAMVVLCAVILQLVEIVRRYVFGAVFYWSQDAVTYFIIGSIFMFFTVTHARRSQLVVTALLDVFKRRGHTRVIQWIRTINSTIGLVFFSSFAYCGFPAVERMAAIGRTTQSMLLLLWPFQLCLFAGFVLMAVISCFQLYQDVQALRGITVFPWAETEEGIDI